MAKQITKFEVIGFTITDHINKKFVKRTCSVSFDKSSNLLNYKIKKRVEYKRKYANKKIDGITFGKEIEIDFTTRTR